MANDAAGWHSEAEELLLDIIAYAQDQNSARRLLYEICTPEEVARFVERLGVAVGLHRGKTYRQIYDELGASTYVVSRAKREIIESKEKFIVAYLTGIQDH